MADNEKYQTPKGRLSFTQQLFVPKAFNGGKPKYGCTILFDKKAQLTVEYKALEAAVETKLEEKFGAKYKTMRLKRPFLDGNEFPNYAGYADMTFLRVSSEYKPGFVDKKAIDIAFDDAEEEIYSGCYARMTLNAFAYDTQGNRGCAFGLRNIQKLGDGESLGGRASASSEFGAVEDDDEDLDALMAKAVG